MPDATGLELTAQQLQESIPDSILGTEFHRGRAALVAAAGTLLAVVSGAEGLGTAHRLLAALERIPLRRRAVLVMHEIDGVPVQEVATALGSPRFTVYSRLRKARRELESALRR